MWFPSQREAIAEREAKFGEALPPALAVEQQAVPAESSSVSHNSAYVRWVVNLFNDHETVGSSE